MSSSSQDDDEFPACRYFLILHVPMNMTLDEDVFLDFCRGKAFCAHSDDGKWWSADWKNQCEDGAYRAV